MAERRMFAKSIVESARFLKMPVSSQLLYFHLGMNADDDGIVEAYSVINLVRAHEDDLRVLYSKGFVRILNEDLVTYISDWRQQNKIRPDRKKDSIYANLLLKIEPDVVLLEKKERSDLVKKSGPSMDGKMSAQCSVVENSVVEDNTVEYSVVSQLDTHTIMHQLDGESLAISDYNNLIKIYPQVIVDGVISRILKKPYHGCLNVRTISSWCIDQIKGGCVSSVEQKKSKHTEQLIKLSKERPSS